MAQQQVLSSAKTAISNKQLSQWHSMGPFVNLFFCHACLLHFTQLFLAKLMTEIVWYYPHNHNASVSTTPLMRLKHFKVNSSTCQISDINNTKWQPTKSSVLDMIMIVLQPENFKQKIFGTSISTIYAQLIIWLAFPLNYLFLSQVHLPPSSFPFLEISTTPHGNALAQVSLHI